MRTAIVSVFAVCLVIVSIVMGAIAVVNMAHFGYLNTSLGSDYHEEIVSDPQINAIAEKYIGISAEEVKEKIISDGKHNGVTLLLAAEISALYTRKATTKVWKSNKDKYIKRYESAMKRYAEIGTVKQLRLIFWGFWGVGFIIFAIWVLGMAYRIFTEGGSPGDYMITSLGEIVSTGGSTGCFGAVLFCAIFLAIGIFGGPIVNVILGITIFKLA